MWNLPGNFIEVTYPGHPIYNLIFCTLIGKILHWFAILVCLLGIAFNVKPSRKGPRKIPAISVSLKLFWWISKMSYHNQAKFHQLLTVRRRMRMTVGSTFPILSMTRMFQKFMLPKMQVRLLYFGRPQLWFVCYKL